MSGAGDRHLRRPRLPGPHRATPRRFRRDLGFGRRARVSGSIPPPRWPARNGSRWPRRRAWPRARASFPPPRSSSQQSRRCSATASRRGAASASIRRPARVEALRERRLGAIRLSSGPDSAAEPGGDRGGIARRRARAWSRAVALVRGRAGACATAGKLCRDRDADRRGVAADRSTTGCRRLLAGKRRLDAVGTRGADPGARRICSAGRGRRRSTVSPRRDFDTPAGSSHAIDYAAEAGPTVEVRVQALFGLGDAPDARRRDAAGAQPHFARRPADPDDARFARLLERKLGRGGQGNARALSAPSLARRPGKCLGRRCAPKMLMHANAFAALRRMRSHWRPR